MPKSKRKDRKRKGGAIRGVWPSTRGDHGFRFAHTYNVVPGRITPDEEDVVLTYQLNAGISAIAGAAVSRRWQPNAPYDVDPTLGSTSTPGFAEKALLYANVRVVRYSYELTVVNTATTPVQSYLLNDNADPGVVANNFDFYSVHPYCQHRLLTVAGGCHDSHVYRGTRNVAQISGDRAVEFDSTYSSLVTTVPSDKIFLALGLSNPTGAAISAVFDVRISMHCRFYGRKTQLATHFLEAFEKERSIFKEQQERERLEKLLKDKQKASIKDV